MANEPLALAPETAAPSEDEYDAFITALSASARGRVFLAEHGRRQRMADTQMLLTALGRLETQVAAVPPPLEADPIREELGILVEAIRSVQAEIDASNLAMQVAKLTSMVEVLKARIEGIAASRGATEPAFEMPAPAPVTLAAAKPVAAAPSAEAKPPAPRASSIPEVSWFESLPPAENENMHEPPAAAPQSTLAIAFVAEVAGREATQTGPDAPAVKVIKAGTIPPPALFAGEDFSAAPTVKTVPKTDLLDSIMALSDDERTALFT